MNVYVLSGVARDIPLSTMFRGTAPFVIADVLALLIAIPALVLWLPGSLMRCAGPRLPRDLYAQDMYAPVYSPVYTSKREE